ncbi:hypothetical protein ACFUTV_20965 [Streptomyces sp. NPDC057298]|uniref:hypothetical protein n=1 Tax=Streptomyces sp. NPDC057298 TaxID=3346091 RepID=UPI003642F00D
MKRFFSDNTPPNNELLIFTIDANISGADANKLYRMAANKMVTTVVDDALRHIPGGARRPGQYAEVSRDGTRFAYGGNVSGGDPCVPSDGVTVVDLDTGKHTTTALADDDASRRLRITGVWFGPKDEVWVSAFRQPAEACVAYGEEEVSRGLRTVVYRLDEGTWTKSDQEAVMAQPAEDGWSARRAGATGLNDYRPPASPLVVTNSKSQRVPLDDSVTVFA